MNFSVLMCVNVHIPFLEDAINSVLNMEYESFEFVIVANNCTDDLFEFLSQFTSDSRVRLFRTQLGQLAFNLNFGAMHCTGHYIVRMDADDLCYRSRLTVTKELLEENGLPDVLACSCDLIDDNGCIIGANILNPDRSIKFPSRAWFRNPVIHPASAIKRSTLLASRGYAGGLNAEDYDLWTRLDRGGSSFHFSGLKVLQYRINSLQSKGSRIGYADAAGIQLREFLMRGDIRFLLGSIITTLKVFYIFYLKKFFRV